MKNNKTKIIENIVEEIEKHSFKQPDDKSIDAQSIKDFANPVSSNVEVKQKENENGNEKVRYFLNHALT